MKPNDPTPDIYEMLDQVGLNGATLLVTREPMAKIVNTMRGEIVAKFKHYIEEDRKTRQVAGIVPAVTVIPDKEFPL